MNFKAICLAVLAFFGMPVVAPISPPNVIIIVMDDVGASDIIPNPLTPTIETPNIDAIAARGITFRRAYGQAVCETSRFALMFGMYGQTAGSVCFGPDINTPDINWPSLPKIFKAVNYSTGFFGKWHLGDNNVGAPWELTPQLHGFDVVKAGLPSNLSTNSCGEGFDGDYTHWLRFEDGISFIDNHYNTTAIRNQFMLWWAQTSGPKFAYVAFQAAHAPFNEPPLVLVPNPPAGGPGYSANRILFEKMVISVDTILLQMYQTLDLSNTYIFIIGDNGTPPNAIGPGQDHNKVKATVFEGGVNVPLIVIGPGIPQGAISDSLVGLVDLPATVAQLISSNIVFSTDSISFKDTLFNPINVTRDHSFVHYIADTPGGTQKQRAVIQDQYKLMRLGGREQFYDLLNDPTESNPLDVNLMDPIIVQALRDQMSLYIARGF